MVEQNIQTYRDMILLITITAIKPATESDRFKNSLFCALVNGMVKSPF